VFGEDVVEGFEVAGFLVVHVLHQRSEVRVRFGDGRGLSGVDERCGEFACLVDPEGGFEVLLLCVSEGPFGSILAGIELSCGR
jgi:hypothetical protein